MPDQFPLAEFLAGAGVDPAVFALRPDYRALLVAVDGLVPGASDSTSEALLRAAESTARQVLNDQPVEQLPQVAAWREAYRAFGAKPQRTRNSLEALLRRAGGGLPRVNRLTDLYNAVSVLHQIPLGGEDLTRYDGSPQLLRARGDEPFDTASGGIAMIEHPDPGEVVWCDDTGVTCRRWNWRQARRTQLRADTTTALFILDALDATSDDELHKAAADLLTHVTRLGPQVRIAQRLIAQASPSTHAPHWTSCDMPRSSTVPDRPTLDSHAARPDKHDAATLSTDSWAVHGGNRPDLTTGAIRTPIVMANSYLLPEDPTTLDDGDPDLLVYTRESGANQLGLQDKLARLDHGEAAAVFATGMAALHATFFTTLDPGDHAIVSNVVYMRTFGLFSSLLPSKLGIHVDLVDITDLDAVHAAVRPTTRLIHTEVIANPDLRVSDIAALAQIAHDNNALLTVDSTFTPPPLMRPLDHGADLVIHSLTKYINGHGDAMGGAVIGRRYLIDQIKFGALHHVGGAIAPFNAWLIMRGSITLPLRLQRHCENALAVADFLAGDPRIAYVAYPGLAGDPHHAAAAAQLTGGHGGIVSFAIAGSHKDRLRFVNDLRLITSAVSLGHDETLIAYEQYPADRAAPFAPVFQEHGLIRLAIGLESAADIISDLDGALTSTYGPAPTATH